MYNLARSQACIPLYFPLVASPLHQSTCIQTLQMFVIYNNYKNHIINNKSDKSKILNLRMVARHCQ
jgi:hypothetical protein